MCGLLVIRNSLCMNTSSTHFAGAAGYLRWYNLYVDLNTETTRVLSHFCHWHFRSTRWGSLHTCTWYSTPPPCMLTLMHACQSPSPNPPPVALNNPTRVLFTRCHGNVWPSPIPTFRCCGCLIIISHPGERFPGDFSFCVAPLFLKQEPCIEIVLMFHIE